jgi:predicted TIM-barrel fold metal-dependent hydrolase
MSMSARNALVVDADTHFWQPIDIWKEFIDPAQRQNVVSYIESHDLFPKATLSLHGARESFLINADDTDERLAWMNSEAIDACIIYPSGMNTLVYVPDPDLAAAACRGLNRWAAQFADADRDRLKPCMVLPWFYPERAVEELEVAVGLGLEVAFASPTPYLQRRWSDPALDCVWQALQDAGVVMTFHEFTRLSSETTQPVARPTYTLPMMYLCGHTVEIQLSVMDLILGGVFSRFPQLPFGFAEGHAAWLPGWLQMLDTAWERPIFVRTRIEAGFAPDAPTPSELFQRQGFVVAFPEDKGLDQVIELIGPQCLMLSTDYPHANATYGLVKRFDETYPNVSNKIRAQALGGNAQRIFGLRPK